MGQSEQEQPECRAMVVVTAAHPDGSMLSSAFSVPSDTVWTEMVENFITALRGIGYSISDDWYTRFE